MKKIKLKNKRDKKGMKAPFLFQYSLLETHNSKYMRINGTFVYHISHQLSLQKKMCAECIIAVLNVYAVLL